MLSFNKMNKKGIALNQAFGAVLTLVLVAVLVIVGIIIFVNLNSAFAGTTSVTETGESLTPSGDGVAVNGAANCSFGGFSITTATNVSGELMNSGNFTTTAAGLVINTTVLTGDNNITAPPWVLNYTYTWGSEACDAGRALIVQFATYPALVGLVGTIIFLGIVIGVLVASFVFGKRKDGV